MKAGVLKQRIEDELPYFSSKQGQLGYSGLGRKKNGQKNVAYYI